MAATLRSFLAGSLSIEDRKSYAEVKYPECPLLADTIEKLENCGVLHFCYQSKISKIAAKFAHPDSQVPQVRDT